MHAKYKEEKEKEDFIHNLNMNTVSFREIETGR
jgi:hypothetical protein